MPREFKVKSVRALERGLVILDAIRARGRVSLSTIHKETALPRATILRALRTLQEQGWIATSNSDLTYSPGQKLLGPTKHGRAREISELAAPVLAALNKKVPWPTDVAVRRGTHMSIVQSSRSCAPFEMNDNAQGRRPCMLRSAVGRAYLAFCSEVEREEILTALRKSSHPDDRPASAANWVANMLGQIRKQGYGVREAGYWAGFEDYGVEVSAIAVPVTGVVSRKVAACMNMMWVLDSQSVDEFAAQNLPELTKAAEALSELISAQTLN